MRFPKEGVPPAHRRKCGTLQAADHRPWFIATRVPASPEKPHGLDYSLTLHGPSGERLVGFDNAHPVGRGRRGKPLNHRHRLHTVKPYGDAATLLADFWQAVDAVLKERGAL